MLLEELSCHFEAALMAVSCGSPLGFAADKTWGPQLGEEGGCRGSAGVRPRRPCLALAWGGFQAEWGGDKAFT